MSRRKLADTVRKLDVISPVSRALTKSPTSSNPLSKPVTPDDSIFFDLFRHATVKSTCSVFPSTFWSETVMQIAHQEPAIWHATLAIAALHKSTQVPEGDEQSLAIRAETHYAKALGLARDITTSLGIATLSAVLVSAASLLGRWSEMQKHVMAGLRIVSQQYAPNLRVVVSTLMKLDLQAMTFSESSSPYPYETTVAAFPVAQYLALPPVQGTSYEELSSEMFGLVRSYMILGDNYIRGNVAYGPWLTSREMFFRRLAHWELTMAYFESTHPPSPKIELTRLCIRLWHVTARILMRATPIGGETRFDSLLGYFEYGVKVASAAKECMRKTEKNSFSLESALVAPLWLLIHRCRHLGLRHAALKLLQDINRTEAMWKSQLAAAAMKALVDVEEECLHTKRIPILLNGLPLNVPWHIWARPGVNIPTTLSWENVPVIPEEHRVKDLLGLMSVHQSRVDIRLLMSADTVDSAELGPVREITVEI
ncbi:hypothetical protein FHETE_10977 [Fusarium heterosporum]|uniref:Uncharacterized protein n=1 Tax=Fusarium heterosporum TaxID=42747 RepID=A0A8H5STB8_FUSHE|nr:hypothetical protein FHETE_10977 [Fusarium heterosporum]